MNQLKYILLIGLIAFCLQTPKAFAAGEKAEELKEIWVASFMLMTEQLTTNMMQQVQIIGTFFDAKHQLETQRLFQQLQAQAHKDYHPSEQMCEIGTFVRNLARADEQTKVTRNAIQHAAVTRQLGSGDVKTVEDQSNGSDQQTRAKLYIDTFCNIHDNAGQNNLLCGSSKAPNQQNADINYTQTIDFPLTFNLDLTDGDVTPEETNIFAFIDQIFMNQSFPDVPPDKTVLYNFVKPYQEMRSLVSMRTVAQNSFAHIIGEKTAATTTEGDVTPYFHSLLVELGMSPLMATEYMSDNPSYYAQMEILTKKIFQNPKFMANLYDKPTNVKRIRAALSAIKSMQDRDIHEAMQRREMLTSMILEIRLRDKQNSMTKKIEDLIALPPDPPQTGAAAGAGTGATF